MYPIQDYLECKNNTLLMTKVAEKPNILWGHTYLDIVHTREYHLAFSPFAECFPIYFLECQSLIMYIIIIVN